jgi:hypothetical protein
MKKTKCPACLGTGEVQDQEVLGKALKSLRKKSLSATARAMGITPSHLCYLEQGKRRWNPALVAGYRRACK